jgi:hypothetical protein
MDLRKSKRGTEYFEMQWQMILSIFLAFVVVFVPLMAFILSLTSSEYFEKNYLAVDLSLTAETMLASPNDVAFNYEKETKSFTVNLKENMIQVYNKIEGLIGGSMGESYFIENPKIKIDYSEIEPSYDVDNNQQKSVIPLKLTLIKAGDIFKIYNSNDKALNENELNENI